MTESNNSGNSRRSNRGRPNSSQNKGGGASGGRGRSASSGGRKPKGPNTSLEKAIASIVKTTDSLPVTGTGSFDEATISDSFRELGLIPELLHGVSDMGYLEPSPIQTKAIPVALEGHDLIGCAQTGTGKTAAFALPALQRMLGGSGTRVLALAPTRELAIQVADQFEKLGKYLSIKVALVYGGVDYEPQIQSLVNESDVVVATPGRLLDHIKRKTVDFANLEVLILDEADRMLDMGFAEEITDILKRLPTKRQTMLFSATIPTTISTLASKALTSPVDISVATPSTPADGIFHGVYPLSGMNKARAVLEILQQSNAKSVLVFTRTKSGADQLSDLLERSKITVSRIHSDRSQRQREKALKDFKDGAHKILVATDIVARGIDVTDITHVINYDVPEYPEDYVHRAGRTARAGQIGYALTLMSPSEIMLVKGIERFIGKALPRLSLPSMSDDAHQGSLAFDPQPLKDQPSVDRYDRSRGRGRGAKVARRTGLSLR